MDNKPFIELPTQGGYEIIHQKDIISVSSEDKMVCFTINNERKIWVRGTMADTEDVLCCPDLQRCHQRHIINLRMIKQVLKQRKGVVMLNDETIPVSRSYKDKVFSQFEKLCVKWGRK